MQMRGPLPWIANRGQSLFTDRDLRGLRMRRPAALAARVHAAPTAQPVVESGAPDRCAGLVGNCQAKVLFEQAESEAQGETTVLQNRVHPSQKKFFDFLCMHICMPLRPVECRRRRCSY